MRRCLVGIFLILIPVWEVCSQTIELEHYNDKDGLSHNSVRHIVQDEQGFLWLGTFNGLNRFDGFQFRNFLSHGKKENTIPDDDITAMKLDTVSNSLWMGTRKGLCRLDLKTQTFSTFPSEGAIPDSLPDKEVRAVFLDRFGRVWVGTKNAGLFLFDPEKNQFTKIPLNGYYYVKEIVEDQDGNIWVGSYNTGGIAKIKLGSEGMISEIRYYALPTQVSNGLNPYVYFIYEDVNRNIFVGTREGLFKFDKEQEVFKELRIADKEMRDKLGPYFQCIAQAPDGKYWVGTLGGLLVCDSLEDIPSGNFEWHFSMLSEDRSLVDNLISALYFDPSGVLWIGTGEGLDKYDPYENQFRLKKDISNYIENQVPRIRGFAKTDQGEAVVATRHNGLFVSRGDKFVPLFNQNHDIASIYSPDGRTFYCGLWNGKLLLYDNVHKTASTLDVGFKDSPIVDLMMSGEKLVVTSFGEGVILLDKKLMTASSHLLPGYNINRVASDTKDNLWFATENGVVKYDIRTADINSYGESDQEGEGLPHANVSDVLVDSRGMVWAATRKGLGVYDAKTDSFKAKPVPGELEGNWVTDIVEDDRGFLWLNLNDNRISRYDVQKNQATLYHVKSGNRLDVFSTSGFYFLDNSYIYLGGKNGIIFFSPQSMEENDWSPRPMISEFKVNNELVMPGVKTNGQVAIQEDLNYSRSAVLAYDNRNFSIEFSSASFTNQRLNKFQYILKGFDQEWIETSSTSRVVQYTNLPWGDYTFQVKASNSDGKWSEVSAFDIKILPPFWTSPKGILLIVFIMVVVGFFARKQIRARISLRQELLTEKVRRERDEKLNNEKLRFFTNISHELRTPLSLIQGPVTQILEHGDSDDFVRNKASLISHSTNRLLRLVNQILDFRRAETGDVKLKVSRLDLLPYTKNVYYSFSELAQSKHINLNINLEGEPMVCWIDIDKYSKILYNLLSNALKFTNKHGNVDLFVGLSDRNPKMLMVEVSDDGIGIPEDSQEKIFTRFFQASNSRANTTGTGIGLALVKSLVEIHRGKISVKSSTDAGSIFTVELPVYKEAFDSSELATEALEKEGEVSLGFTKSIYPQLSAAQSHSNTEVKPSILVIDDSADLRKYIVEFLSPHYRIYEAENGKEGLEVCHRIRPVLCVVDAMMPVMDGFEFVNSLKNDEKISHTAIVMLTALSENENRIRGYKIGIDGYVVKPFDPFLLKSRIDSIIKTRYELKQQFSNETESDLANLAYSQIDIDLVSKIKVTVEENIANPDLTPSFLCSELGVSSSHLYRKITELTGMPPNEFIRTLRLKKSAILLKSKKYNVSEVANSVGFNDPLYFSRRFKEQFGYAPSKLIK